MEKCSQCGAPLENHRCSYCGANYQTQNQIQNEPQTQAQSVQTTSPSYQQVIASVVNQVTQVNVVNRQVPVYANQKSKSVALLLCIFFGYFGAHKFYLGKTKMGILYALTFGLGTLGWAFDIFMILFTRVTDSNGVPIG